MDTRPMTIEALGLTDHGVRVQVTSSTALMAVSLSRESAISHAAQVLRLAGIARLDIDPDGAWHAHERSN